MQSEDCIANIPLFLKLCFDFLQKNILLQKIVVNLPKTQFMSKTSNIPQITDMKQRMSNIMLSVSWREIARTYFDNSVSWFYHKMDGIDGNGGFTPQEAQQLKSALCDLAERIRRCADKI